RPALLVKVEHHLRLYPQSKWAGQAKETAALLRQMIKEDQEHAARRARGKPFAQLSRQEQIAELIFELREAEGQGFLQLDRGGGFSVINTSILIHREKSVA